MALTRSIETVDYIVETDALTVIGNAGSRFATHTENSPRSWHDFIAQTGRDSILELKG